MGIRVIGWGEQSRIMIFLVWRKIVDERWPDFFSGAMKVEDRVCCIYIACFLLTKQATDY